MALLIDTQTLVWIGSGDRRLPAAVRERLLSSDEELWVSAVTAFEYTDLNDRGRFDADMPLRGIVDLLEAKIVAFPHGAWLWLANLPDLHRDPVDRMTVAHALDADVILVTSDETMRRYPVRSLW